MMREFIALLVKMLMQSGIILIHEYTQRWRRYGVQDRVKVFRHSGIHVRGEVKRKAFNGPGEQGRQVREDEFTKAVSSPY